MLTGCLHHADYLERISGLMARVPALRTRVGQRGPSARADEAHGPARAAYCGDAAVSSVCNGRRSTRGKAANKATAEIRRE